MAKKKEQGEYALEQCRLNRTLPDRTLARQLRKERPDLYSSIESARGVVKYYRGHKGEAAKQELAETDCLEDYRNTDLPDRMGKLPKILIFDIETAPSLAYVWGMFKVFVQPSQLVQPGKILSYAGKWLGKDDIYFDSIKPDIPNSKALNVIKKSLNKLLDFKAFDVLWNILLFYSASDKRLCESLYELFDEADIVVAHNGQAFDVHTMNAYWVKHGMVPPSPYKVVDTLKIAKKNFRFPRNKLESIAKFLDIGKKTEHEGFDLWVKCMAKDKDAWDKMEEYNIQDINLLEEVYIAIRSWDKNHPNVALLYDNSDMRCTACGSHTLQMLTQQAYTAVSEFESFRCQNCGKILRSGKREKVPVGVDIMRNVQ